MNAATRTCSEGDKKFMKCVVYLLYLVMLDIYGRHHGTMLEIGEKKIGVEIFRVQILTQLVRFFFLEKNCRENGPPLSVFCGRVYCTTSRSRSKKGCAHTFAKYGRRQSA